MDLPDIVPTVTVSFPDALRARIGNRRFVTATGRTVREIIDALDGDFPGLEVLDPELRHLLLGPPGDACHGASPSLLFLSPFPYPYRPKFS